MQQRSAGPPWAHARCRASCQRQAPAGSGPGQLPAWPGPCSPLQPPSLHAPPPPPRRRPKVTAAAQAQLHAALSAQPAGTGLSGLPAIALPGAESVSFPLPPVSGLSSVLSGSVGASNQATAARKAREVYVGNLVRGATSKRPKRPAARRCSNSQASGARAAPECSARMSWDSSGSACAGSCPNAGHHPAASVTLAPARPGADPASPTPTGPGADHR
jgi:hypothetical protein